MFRRLNGSEANHIPRTLLLCAGLLVLIACGGGSTGPVVGSGPVAPVSVAPTPAIVVVGGTVQLTATPKDAAGNPLTGRIVTWAISASAVASVSATGLVTGLAPGWATITATSERQSGSAAITVGLVLAAVSAGLEYTCGRITSGAAYCWGLNASGQLGEGSTTNSSTPVAVLGSLTFAAVGAG